MYIFCCYNPEVIQIGFPITITEDNNELITANMVDIIASFHECKIKPLYFRVTDRDGLRHEYRIERVISNRHQKWCGLDKILYMCEYKIDDEIVRQIELMYHVREHVWTVKR